MDLPAFFVMDMAIKGEFPISWNEDYPSRPGVMPRRSDRERDSVELGVGKVPGEAVFVRADGGEKEDDGY